MHGAAREAAWRYDHPKLKYVVDALEWVGGVFVAIALLIAIVLAFKAILAALAIVLGKMVAELVAGFVAGFLIGYFGAQAYEARVAKGQSGGAAFLGALADISGVTALRRSFTDDSLSMFKRGMLFGEGLVLSSVSYSAAPASCARSRCAFRQGSPTLEVRR